jgi:hypothetical protein
MHRAVFVCAYRRGGAYPLAIDDDRGLGEGAWQGWFSLWVFHERLDLAIVTAGERSSSTVLWISPNGLDLH